VSTLVILEGFLEAESKHGLRYMRLVGDGESSVFSRIRQEVPGWGRYVLLNLFVAVFLSQFLSLYSFERTRMAHLTALTSLTLVVLERPHHACLHVSQVLRKPI
jgi:hypothetical protein